MACGYWGARKGKKCGFGVSQTRVRIPSLNSCVTFNEFLIAEPQPSFHVCSVEMRPPTVLGCCED